MESASPLTVVQSAPVKDQHQGRSDGGTQPGFQSERSNNHQETAKPGSSPISTAVESMTPVHPSSSTASGRPQRKRRSTAAALAAAEQQTLRLTITSAGSQQSNTSVPGAIQGPLPVRRNGLNPSSQPPAAPPRTVGPLDIRRVPPLALAKPEDLGPLAQASLRSSRPWETLGPSRPGFPPPIPGPGTEKLNVENPNKVIPGPIARAPPSRSSSRSKRQRATEDDATAAAALASLSTGRDTTRDHPDVLVPTWNRGIGFSNGMACINPVLALEELSRGNTRPLLLEFQTPLNRDESGSTGGKHASARKRPAVLLSEQSLRDPAPRAAGSQQMVQKSKVPKLHDADLQSSSSVFEVESGAAETTDAGLRRSRRTRAFRSVADSESSANLRRHQSLAEDRAAGRSDPCDTTKQLSAPEDETDTRLGPECQAEVPDLATVRQRPARLSSDELRWVSGRLELPQGVGQDQWHTLPPPAEEDSRRIWIEEARNALVARINNRNTALSLGLDRMGSALCPQYSPAEEIAIVEAMRRYGRDFNLIVKKALSHRTVPDLVMYYFNLLKTGATPVSRAWIQEKQNLVDDKEEEEEDGGRGSVTNGSDLQQRSKVMAEGVQNAAARNRRQRSGHTSSSPDHKHLISATPETRSVNESAAAPQMTIALFPRQVNDVGLAGHSPHARGYKLVSPLSTLPVPLLS